MAANMLKPLAVVKLLPRNRLWAKKVLYISCARTEFTSGSVINGFLSAEGFGHQKLPITPITLFSPNACKIMFTY